jgi:plasminogen activator
MRNKIIAAFAAPLLVSGSVAFAGDFSDKPVLRTNNVSLDLGLGVLTGKANEYVYNEDGRKVSQLSWKYDNDLMLRGGAEWTPLHWLTIGLKGGINVTQDSTMDDWDWIYVRGYGRADYCDDGTLCHSHHDDTDLERKATADVYLAGTVLREGTISLAGLAGFKHDYSKWKAYGGISNYGDLPDGLGITYAQTWETPYLGIQFQAALGRWSFLSTGVGSWWASGHAEDIHHLRGLFFKDELGTTNMIGAMARVGYQLANGCVVNFQYDYERFGTAKGLTNIPVASIGGNYVSSITEPEAGADNTAHTVSLGLNYKF